VQGTYIYGIVGFPPELARGIQGLGGNPVRLLPQGDVAAVMSPSPLSPWPLDEAHLILHETVVEDVMDTRPILPVRYNTLLRTEEAVITLLAERAQAFRSALERVAGRVEMGLRILWEPAAETGVSPDQEIEERGPGAEYLYQRLREERRRSRLQAEGETLIHELQASFLPLAVESCLHPLPTKRLLLTAAYLVDRDRVEAFRKLVTKVWDDFQQLQFLLTGPWPPYHFVNGTEDIELCKTNGKPAARLPPHPPLSPVGGEDKLAPLSPIGGEDKGEG